MEKILLIIAFAGAVVYLGFRIRRSLLRVKKKDCGPDCNCN